MVGGSWSNENRGLADLFHACKVFILSVLFALVGEIVFLLCRCCTLVFVVLIMFFYFLYVRGGLR